jgi:hypothetical protein
VREQIEAKNGLESYIYETKNKMEKELKDKIHKDLEESAFDKIKELDEWLQSHPSETKDVYDEKKKELEDIFLEVMKSSMNNGAMPPNPDGESGTTAFPPGPDGKPFMPPGNGVPYNMDNLPPMSRADFTGMSNSDPSVGVRNAKKEGSLPKDLFPEISIDEVD